MTIQWNGKDVSYDPTFRDVNGAHVRTDDEVSALLSRLPFGPAIFDPVNGDRILAHVDAGNTVLPQLAVTWCKGAGISDDALRQHGDPNHDLGSIARLHVLAYVKQREDQRVARA